MTTDCAQTTPLPAGQPLPAATILIVEDDDDLATLLEYRLRHAGLTPLIARDGDEACRLLAAEPSIDLALLDILLPVMDGWGVCRWIRRHPEPRIAALPVIMLTALAASDNRVKGMKCGADLYLAKPYSVREVIVSCRKLVVERRERRRLESEVVALRAQQANGTAAQRMLFHELRSQFTVIGGLCHRLLKGDASLPGQAKGREYLQVIRHSVNEVSEMADGMLLLAKLDSAEPALPREECRLDQIVADVVAVHLATAQQKRVDIDVSPLPSEPVRLHRLAVKVILSSLLENAVKYCPPASAIALVVTVTEARIRLEVIDQGPGIPQHEHQKIFAPYYRGEATRESHKGTGLGLYSVKRLTEALGGEVRLASVPGEGSLFSITFRCQ